MQSRRGYQQDEENSPAVAPRRKTPRAFGWPFDDSDSEPAAAVEKVAINTSGAPVQEASKAEDQSNECGRKARGTAIRSSITLMPAGGRADLSPARRLPGAKDLARLTSDRAMVDADSGAGGSLLNPEQKRAARGVTGAGVAGASLGRGMSGSGWTAERQKGSGAGGTSLYSEVEEPPDPVERCFAFLTRGLACVLVLWIAGGFSIALCLFHSMPGGESYWLAFTPVWLGDLATLIILGVTAMKGFRIGLEENQRVLRSVRYGSIQMGERRRSTLKIADRKYMRFVVGLSWGSIFCVPVFLCTIVLSHLMFCSYLESGGLSPSLASCLGPLMALELLMLLRVVILRDHGALSLAAWALAFAGTLMVGLRAGGQAGLARWPWWLAMVPLWALGGLLLGCMAYVLYSAMRGRYRLSGRQQLCVVLYGGALACSTAGALMSSFAPWGLLGGPWPWRHHVPAYLLLGALALFAGGLHQSVVNATRRLLVTQGFEYPRPLSKTARGWEPAGIGVVSWGLLGDIEVQSAVKAALPARVAEHGRGVASESPMHSEDLERGNFPRTDSGTYEDIYEAFS